MRLFFTIMITFLAALLLEILPFPAAMAWFEPNWTALVLIFWMLALPYRVGMMVAFLLGLILDLLMGTLLGQHALAFVVIGYFILRFHMRLQLFPLWQQAVMVFIMLLLCQTFFSWVNGLIGGFRADAWFWLPALISAILWPWIYSILKHYTRHYRLHKL